MKRYLALLGSVLIQTCLGGIYAWSVFVPPLKGTYGLTTGQTQLIFGVCVATFIVAMLFAGQLQERRGPRLTAALGGVLFGGGFLLASFTRGSFPGLLTCVGLVAGAGIGFGYVCPIATCVRWFPRHKGLVTGIAVAGFGGGAILLSNVGNALLARGVDALTIFRGAGVCYGVTVVLGALLMFVPGAADAPASGAPARTSVRAFLRDPRFAFLFGGMFSGTFAGLMTIGNLKPMGLAGGVAPAVATLAISALAVGNAGGRLVWGFISDRLREKAIPLSLGFMALAAFGLVVATRATAPFVVNAVAAGFGFGACLVLYAAAVAHLWGPEQVGRLYPWVSLSYALSGTLGPPAGGWLYDLTGSYTAPLVIAGVLAAAGCGAVALFGLKTFHAAAAAAYNNSASVRG